MKPRLKNSYPRAYSNQCIIRRPKAKLNHVIICKACTCITSANLPLAKASHMAEINNSGMWKYALPLLFYRNITAWNKWRTENTSYYSVQRAHQYDPRTKTLKHSKYILMRNSVRKAEMNDLFTEFNNGKLLLKSQSSSKFRTRVRRLCSTDI